MKANTVQAARILEEKAAYLQKQAQELIDAALDIRVNVDSDEGFAAGKAQAELNKLALKGDISPTGLNLLISISAQLKEI